MKTIIVNLVAGPGSGKCFSKNTKVLMYDGTVKNVEDIIIGDVVMGDDSTPRKVIELHNGKSEMYRLKRSKSKDIIVSDNHILSLYNYKRDGSWYYDELTINDYMNKTKKYKHYARLYKKDVVFNNNDELKVEPYYLGYWLGDGVSESLNRFCTADSEILEYCSDYANRLGLKINQSSHKEYTKCQTYTLSTGISGNNQNHPLSHKIYNLCNNKHIPLVYKTSSMESRLELIAGLIDSDGSLSRTGYDWINKNEQLSYDFYHLVNSCGLRANIKKCKKKCCDFEGDYFRVSITGEISKIPIKIERKKPKITKKDDSLSLREGFSVEPIGLGDYYGFTTDNNGRFLLDDCTVVHNSTGMAYIFSKLKMEGIDCEMVTEFAKDQTWEKNLDSLNCQFYISGQQAYRIFRLYGKVQVVITDSPVIQGVMYTDDNHIVNACVGEQKKYPNQMYYFIERKKAYNPNGRNQTEDEAIKIDYDLIKLLTDNDIRFKTVEGNRDGYDEICKDILERLK